MPPSCDVSPSHEGSCSFGCSFLPVARSRGRAQAGQSCCHTLRVPLPTATDTQGPAWPSRGDLMDDDRPLFITFKPLGEDNTARAKPALNTTPIHPQGAEQPPGHHNRHGRVPPDSWSPPPARSLPEEDQWPERVALRAQTRLWFEQTQAQRLGPKGELPVWFHGFISRREAEELLQDQPLGCFLVRFSESTIGFVLSYRGRDRCRHFVLDQQPDGRYVILGERSAHAELAQLLQHHSTAPVTPYLEFLTVPLPCERKDKQPGRTDPAARTDVARSPPSEAPAKLPELSPVSLEPPRAPGGSGREAPPALPAKSSSRVAARGSRSPPGPEAPPYAQVHKEAARPEPPEAKYQQLMPFHVYAEPREEIPAEEPTPAEPIPFYAMARGWSPRAGPEENIYSEVALTRQDVPARLPAAPQNAFSTLCPKPRAHRRLFRSVSSQDCRRRQLSVAPSTDRKDRGAPNTGAEVTQNPALELDDPMYGESTHRDQQTTAMAENVYEQLPGDCP